jgi:hypothetical protein
MNMVAWVTNQGNPEREAVADDFESVFVGDFFSFHLYFACENHANILHYGIAPPPKFKG